MISYITGTLLSREIDRIEVATAGGLGYELHIPLSVFERLPRVGDPVTLHTHTVVKEDAWQLFGFATPLEREVFRRVLMAKGVGPWLALGMLSTLNADRLVRAVREKDVKLLTMVPRVGKKKAEQVILDLFDKFDDLAAEQADGAAVGDATAPLPADVRSEDAVRALISLGYSPQDSERAVRAVLNAGSEELADIRTTADLIKRALALAGSGGAR